jgi:hypothetical protein
MDTQINNLTVITVATHADGYLNVLRNKLESAEVKHSVLGYGQKWGGWIWRLKLILTYLKESHQPDDIIMIVDGYDVILTGSRDGILRKYQEFGKDVIFSVHRSKSQKYSFIVEFSTRLISNWFFKNKNQFMKNGGGYMGTAKTLIIIIERMLKYSLLTGQRDDQVILNNIYLEDINHEIDSTSSIFWVWEIETLYEVVYQLLIEYCPSYLGSVKVKDKNALFHNGENPEIIHGIGHRDMSLFVDEKSKLTKHKRKYTQRDIEIILKVVKYLIILGLILLTWLGFRYLF